MSRLLPVSCFTLLLAPTLSACFGGLELWVVPDRAAPTEPVVVIDDAAFDGDVGHVSVFYDALAPWGAWQQDSELGWIWTPSDADYVPYRSGYWVDTDVGPTWIADEPYGWAVTHYGRWLQMAGPGSAAGRHDRWYWVPGVTWSPAWVAWRVGEGAVGWAPLAPRGYEGGTPVDGWSFVPAPDFYTRGVAMRRYSTSYAGWFLYKTRAWQRWAEHDGERRYGVGPRVELGGRPLVQRVRLSSLPQERVRWVPRWSRAEPPVVRSWVSVRAGRDGPERIERAEPDGRAESHHHGPRGRRRPHR